MNAKFAQNYLIMLVGLPYSGKSTLAWQSCCEAIVSPDSIRLALHGQRFIAEAEDFVWGIARVMVNALFFSGTQFVLLDACNNTKVRRDAFKSDKYARIAIVVGTAEMECLRRASEKGDRDILPVIQRMQDNFEYPHCEEEGFIGVINSSELHDSLPLEEQLEIMLGPDLQ